MLQKQQIRRNDQEWMQIIQECRNSGLSDQAWCHEHNISVSTFYNRIKRLQKQACEIPVSKGKASGRSQQVVPLQIIDEMVDEHQNTIAAERPAISIAAGKFHIAIHSHADRETIQNTLLALQQIC